MSRTDAVATAPTPDVVVVESPSAASSSRTWLIWPVAVAVCLALAASGGLRRYQERQVQAVLDSGRDSPFPLEQLPMDLGPWKGEPAKLDSQVARATGSVDHAFRRYVNQMTGATVDLIVLYGPTVEMFIHAPENCYPSAGFKQAGAARMHEMPLGDGRSASFRSLVYTKGGDVGGTRQEVYYAWRYLDRWSPNVGTHKQFERIPGMYKVHLAREIGDGELRGVGNPCESLLEYLVPELERRILAARPATAPTAAAASGTAS